MANYYLQLANYLVNPAEADHHGDDYGTGAGLILYEPLWTLTRYAQGGSLNRVISGFTLPSSGSKDTATITSGSAVIAGYLVKGTDSVTPISFSGAASPVTTYVYLTLVTSGDKVTYPIFQLETTRIASPTKYNLFLGTVTANATTITASNPQQSMGRILHGAISASGTISNYGSGDWTVSSTTITFTTPFIVTPTIMLTPYYVGADYCTAQVTAKSNTAFTAQSYRYNSGTWTATSAFEFMVFG